MLLFSFLMLHPKLPIRLLSEKFQRYCSANLDWLYIHSFYQESLYHMHPGIPLQPEGGKLLFRGFMGAPIL